MPQQVDHRSDERHAPRTTRERTLEERDRRRAEVRFAVQLDAREHGGDVVRIAREGAVVMRDRVAPVRARSFVRCAREEGVHLLVVGRRPLRDQSLRFRDPLRALITALGEARREENARHRRRALRSANGHVAREVIGLVLGLRLEQVARVRFERDGSELFSTPANAWIGPDTPFGGSGVFSGG